MVGVILIYVVLFGDYHHNMRPQKKTGKKCRQCWLLWKLEILH